MHVEVRNLTKTFGPLRANDNISLNFAAGQIHGVLGENGAGKSTLMKMLSGFQRRTSGDILLDGKPAMVDNPGAALASGIGMVYQEPLDVPAFTALENFFCASPRSALPNLAAARRILIDLAHRLDFSTPPDAPIRSLTIGQRQQLEIMRLLACGARVLILDEPTTGITAAQKIALFAALRTLASEGNTVLFVSHKLDEVADLCTTVSVLRAGQVVGEGPMAMPQPQERLLGLMFGELPSKAATSDQPPVTDQTFAVVPPVWRLEQLSAREGALTLRDLTLDIPAGSVFGLAGLEGSGQQLFLHALSGHTRPTTGRIYLAGKDLTNASPDMFRRVGVQHLPADRLAEGMVGDFTLAEHIALQNQHGLLNQQTASLPSSSASISQPQSLRAATPEPDRFALENRLWDSAERGNSLGDYQAYLEAYPSGLYAPMARSRIAKLTPSEVKGQDAAQRETPDATAAAIKTEVGTQETEASLNFDSNKRRELQARLAALNFDVGGVTGDLDMKTRTAIVGWQKNHGALPTGWLGPIQYAALRKETDTSYQNFLFAKPEVSKPQTVARSRSLGHAVEPHHRKAYQTQYASPRYRQQNGGSAGGMDPAGAAMLGGLLGGVIGRFH